MTKLGMNIHIINEHEPKMIYKHFGRDWVMEHRNLDHWNLLTSLEPDLERFKCLCKQCLTAVIVASPTAWINA